MAITVNGTQDGVVRVTGNYVIHPRQAELATRLQDGWRVDELELAFEGGGGVYLAHDPELGWDANFVPNVDSKGSVAKRWSGETPLVNVRFGEMEAPEVTVVWWRLGALEVSHYP